MNYSEVKRLDTVVTANDYVENRIGESVGAEAPVEAKERIKLSLPKFGGLVNRIRNRLDVYDAIMIPVGAGILVAFVMLLLKIV